MFWVRSTKFRRESGPPAELSRFGTCPCDFRSARLPGRRWPINSEVGGARGQFCGLAALRPAREGMAGAIRGVSLPQGPLQAFCGLPRPSLGHHGSGTLPRVALAPVRLRKTTSVRTLTVPEMAISRRSAAGASRRRYRPARPGTWHVEEGSPTDACGQTPSGDERRCGLRSGQGICAPPASPSPHCGRRSDLDQAPVRAPGAHVTV